MYRHYTNTCSWRDITPMYPAIHLGIFSTITYHDINCLCVLCPGEEERTSGASRGRRDEETQDTARGWRRRWAFHQWPPPLGICHRPSLCFLCWLTISLLPPDSYHDKGLEGRMADGEGHRAERDSRRRKKKTRSRKPWDLDSEGEETSDGSSSDKVCVHVQGII